jgi:hypothetical protein
MTDTTPGGWPDAARPGYPQNPDVERWHWLRRKGSSTAEAWLWTDGYEGEFRWWTDDDGDPEDMARQFDYLGPCHTPAEVAALVEAARREERREEREACAQVVLRGQTVLLAGIGPVDGYPWDTAAKAAAAIRARGDA